MSTKTTFKRVALVTVAVLGFGMVSVAPSQAAVATSTVSAASTTLTTTAGTTVSTVISLISAAAADTDTLVITPSVVSRPAGATMAIDANGTLATGEFGLTLTGAATPYSAVDAMSAGVITLTDPADAGVQLTATTAATALGTFSAFTTTPGVYVFRVSVNSTAASTVDITVIALPAQANGTTSLTASVSPSVSVAATDTIITVARNSSGAEADGAILGIVTASSDATDLPIGTVIGRTSSSTTDLEDNVATAVSSANRTFTFDNDLSTKALAVKSTTLSGTYSFTFWVDANSNLTFDSGEVSTTASYTIQPAVSADTGISVSIDNATRANSANVNSFTVTATIADGAAATITESGTFDATNIIAGSSLARLGTSTTYVGTFAVDADPASGSDYEDITLTVTSGAYSNTATLRVVTLAGLTTVAGAKALVLNQSAADTAVGTVTSGVRQTLNAAAAGTVTATVDRAHLSHVYTVNAASGEEGEYVKVAVAPTGTTSSTVVAPTFYLAAIGADLVSTVTVVATAPASGSTYSLTVTGTNSVSAAITFTTAAPRWTVSPSADMKAKYGDKSAITGTLSDNYGRVLASKAISVVVTGRNAGTILGTTDAAGAFKFEWTDASTSTVVLTDSLVFNYVYTASSTSTTTSTASSTAYTVTYSATGIAAASMTVSAPSDTTDRAIDQIQGSSGATTNQRVNFTATVKDAAGAPVGAGLLVTFAGSSADLFYGGVTTAVTDEFGQATVSVYRKLAGTTAITATAGGLTATAAGVKWTNKLVETTTAPYTAAGSADYHARYVTLTADNAKAVSEGIIRFTAKVTDRFGNAVDGVDVLFSETGAGRFYNAPTTTTTNSAGEVSIDLNSQAGETGAVSVTVLISDANARQINDIAGFMSHTTISSGTVAAVASTAVSGVTAAVKSATATAVIEKNTATSTADALLALAQALGTRDQASATVDAAAEATDAANAATDAANAAAEAADAATAAAQDASDAVAALSAQVSEAIAGLKKQLVSLTNLVIKIQKKVKA
jgi:hypothetical protein